MPEPDGVELKYKRRKKRTIAGQTFEIEPPPPKRSKTMQKIKRSRTKPEEQLGKAMWALGLRYRRKNKLPGKPDFVFKGPRVAVFVDGDFWHGKDWDRKKATFKRNREFWIAKIERNMERDREVNQMLQEDGWKVMRFWESEVKKSLVECSEQVFRAVKARSS